MIVREDKLHPWSVLESTEKVLFTGRGFRQAPVKHAFHYALGSIYNRSGYHVFRRRQFNRSGLLRGPAASVLNVANDQFGLWNVSGYPLSVVLILPNTSAIPKSTPSNASNAPFDGAGVQTAFSSAQRPGLGSVLISKLDDKATEVYTEVYTERSERDDEGVILVTTFERGQAHLWDSRPAKRGACLVFLRECLEGKSPKASRTCAEHDFRSTILALHAAGNVRSKKQRTTL